jgi:hypothetical protein
VIYSVGGEVMEKTANNQADQRLGRMGSDGENWDSWNA